MLPGMTASSAPSPLTLLQKGLLMMTALILAAGLFLLRNGLNQEAPLDQLARQSLDPDVALTNSRPTVLEFYADWCEACQAMAPAMLQTEQNHADQLDVVLVNIDNPRWLDLIDKYEVTGIPQLNLFSADGAMRGRSLGARTADQLESLAVALIDNAPLPQLAGVGAISNVTPAETVSSPGPRSHS